MSSSARASALPVRLERKLVERPWGGEIWFIAEDELPLLVKFIYTREALSFQVHPGDEYAAEQHNSRGKTEMWYIASAKPGAKIGLGLRAPVVRERLREASESGEIEHLLNWVSPRVGDVFFTPAGTIHAIGGGIELWEIQENSDITYRLFDYGRGRELHLDHALNVTDTGAFDPTPVPLPVCSDWFCTDKLQLEHEDRYRPDPTQFQLLIVLEGSGTMAGERFEAGEVWMVPAGDREFEVKPDGRVDLLRAIPA